jgi:predicted enzyme involved in methoxymalonyl-ACP biosynthesis
MLHAICERARSWGLKDVHAEYRPTAKNQPCLEFWTKSGFGHDPQTNLFTHDATRSFPLPRPVRLEGDLSCLTQ